MQPKFRSTCRVSIGIASLLLLLFAGVAYAGPVIDVTFQSNTPARPTEPRLHGKMTIAGIGAPALSGAGVKKERELYYAQQLARVGIAALVVDSFATRGLTRGDTTVLSALPLENDAVAAFRWLLADGRFKPDRIGVMGVSKGGVAAMNTALQVRRRWWRMEDIAFAAHIPIVPNCHLVNTSLRTTGAPMFFMLAELDDLTPSRFCVEYAERLRAAGSAKIENKVYKGAHHNWEIISAKPSFDPKFANTSRCRVSFDDDGTAVTPDGTRIPTGGLNAGKFNDWMRQNCMYFGHHCCAGTPALIKEATGDLIRFLKKHGF